MFDDDRDRFVPGEVAAKRMGITVEQVMDLVSQHALRASRYGGWGPPEVEPAILNVRPPPPKKGPAARTRKAPGKGPR